MSDTSHISVVIRTCNSGKTLEQVLSRLALEEGDEFIIVDSGSTDSTLQIAEKHGAKTVIADGPFNYSKSLNLGFQASKNPWVLVISSHCIPVVPDFLAIFRRVIDRFPADVVVGYAPATITGTPSAILCQDKVTYFTKREYEKFGQICGNANTIYRRVAWEELPFDETIRTAEDKLWIMEMVHRDYRFASIPTAPCIHRNQASIAYMVRKGFRDARATRQPHHKPMSLLQLCGALKNLARKAILGQIDAGNWIRHSALTVGQFLGSFKSEDNTPRNGAS